MSLITTGIIMGLLGTVAMDVWAMLLNRFFGQPLPNWGNVGRWAGHLPSGTVFHDDIARVDPIGGEIGLGWAVHYGVGVLYGVAFVLIAGPAWLANPSFVPLWLFSLATIAAGWFLLQPGMGLGWAASKTPQPWKVRVMGLLAHTVFALGMWIGALV
ncbi:DUF2938 domain-containing protein [Thalassococcus lentus]|uniref:DUF2938 domain-containing protein n=1 Tax=Thalassococcus lentus TaxID=1210524 RepID=A0ABT4XX44_9RHOB|nr:DUF2938 domain-containing protein [Thalassococcus lentus]MDA7426502.1 DUF2938 domain-containing protein [Thalassococcus lentus]